MPHLALVTLAGYRVREPELLELGMTLPGLERRAGAIGALPALGLLTLAGLTPDAWEVSYHDAPRVDDALVQRLVARGPALVAISALTASIGEAYELSARLRAEGVRVILGGLHVTACPDEAEDHADAIVVGDGEPVWRRVLDDARADRLLPRYRAERPFDLADAPVPRFDLLGADRPSRFTVQTARGCPLACEFCGASRLLGGFREKPAPVLRQELRAIAACAPNPLIELADDNTFAGSRDPADLFDALHDIGARYFTEADWRIGEQPELLAGLAASGCVQVLVGLESMVHRHRGMGAKDASLARVTDAIDAIQAAGVAVNGCFIVGSDGEDEASIDRLGDLLASSPLAEVQLTILTPFPGTALHRRLAATGRLLPDRDWSHYTLFDVTYRPDRMTVGALEGAFRALVRRVFDETSTRRRQAIRRSIWRDHPRLAS